MRWIMAPVWFFLPRKKEDLNYIEALFRQITHAEAQDGTNGLQKRIIKLNSISDKGKAAHFHTVKKS